MSTDWFSIGRGIDKSDIRRRGESEFCLSLPIAYCHVRSARVNNQTLLTANLELDTRLDSRSLLTSIAHMQCLTISNDVYYTINISNGYVYLSYLMFAKRRYTQKIKNNISIRGSAFECHLLSAAASQKVRRRISDGSTRCSRIYRASNKSQVTGDTYIYYHYYLTN